MLDGSHIAHLGVGYFLYRTLHSKISSHFFDDASNFFDDAKE